MTKILVVDDETDLEILIKQKFRQKIRDQHYEFYFAINGRHALEQLDANPDIDIVLSDINMPEMDGLTLAKRIRQINPQVPIIFLTAKSQKEDILEGFRTGADDYITKPFSMEELLYRIQAVLKRTSASITSLKEEKYTIGKYTFDSVKQLLLFEDESVKLTTKESELLELLCRHGGTILERNFALKTIWTDDNYFNARSMDVYITKLRKYLKKDPSVRILNIHGKGYKLLT